MGPEKLIRYFQAKNQHSTLGAPAPKDEIQMILFKEPVEKQEEPFKLPHEILIMIFVYANKNFLNFALVCHLWAALITSDHFLRELLKAYADKETITHFKHRLVPAFRYHGVHQDIPRITPFPIGHLLNYKLLGILPKENLGISYKKQLHWLQIALHYSLSPPLSPFTVSEILVEQLKNESELPSLLSWLNDPMIKQLLSNDLDFFNKQMHEIYLIGTSLHGYIITVMSIFQAASYSQENILDSEQLRQFFIKYLLNIANELPISNRISLFNLFHIKELLPDDYLYEGKEDEEDYPSRFRAHFFSAFSKKNEIDLSLSYPKLQSMLVGPIFSEDIYALSSISATFKWFYNRYATSQHRVEERIVWKTVILKSFLDHYKAYREPQNLYIKWLIHACSNNDLPIIELFLQMGVRVNSYLNPSILQRFRMDGPVTPFTIGCLKGHQEVIKLLLKYGANLKLNKLPTQDTINLFFGNGFIRTPSFINVIFTFIFLFDIEFISYLGKIGLDLDFYRHYILGALFGLIKITVKLENLTSIYPRFDLGAIIDFFVNQNPHVNSLTMRHFIKKFADYDDKNTVATIFILLSSDIQKNIEFLLISPLSSLRNLNMNEKVVVNSMIEKILDINHDVFSIFLEHYHLAPSLSRENIILEVKLRAKAIFDSSIYKINSLSVKERIREIFEKFDSSLFDLTMFYKVKISGIQAVQERGQIKITTPINIYHMEPT